MSRAFLYVMTMACVTLMPLAASAAQLCHSYWPKPSTPINRFVNNEDGTISDSATGLIWKRCSEGLSGSTCENGAPEIFTWQEALQSAVNSSFAGKNDWRLPNIKELGSIVERQCSMPAINEIVFPATPTMSFWSSSPFAENKNFAWNIYFPYGISDGNDKNYKFFVRLVRGGK
ncbi:DUF1566 domain-containing protein [Geobacter pelophilus]|uniref:DUF1566 domain-containing protein n=1 Tax=Geoanaerobacter pelophilus TaxID=60036 RepID=A0AAW4L9U2_9BACT|nr:DUF1566 domain-containing protein [Geoanaerobacter pelophilus]MBT0664809.1 DUF1566 domain-containing protein [Geoanaerobacter pelophilus]